MYETTELSGAPAQIAAMFERGWGSLVLWDDVERLQLAESMRILKSFLAGTDTEASYTGMERLRADRQSFWLASSGLGAPFSTDRKYLGSLDGNPSAGKKGLEVLNIAKQLRPHLDAVKASLDNALLAAVQGVGIDRDLIPRLSVRYRVIRYAPVRQKFAGIGLHADGNAISALVTDAPGLTLLEDEAKTVAPADNGTLLLPGTILYRWSKGRYRPTFHRVEVDSVDAAKFSVVAFLNFPDRRQVAAHDPADRDGYWSDVWLSKFDDQSPKGDLANFWPSFPSLGQPGLLDPPAAAKALWARWWVARSFAFSQRAGQ